MTCRPGSGRLSFAAMKQIHPAFTMLLTLAVLACSGCDLGMRNRSPAPDFELPNLTGQPTGPSQFEGKVVLIAFWAVDCAECQAQAAHLRELQESHAGDLRVLAVHVHEDIPRTQIMEFTAEQRLPYVVLLHGKEVFRNRYKGDRIPQLHLLDRSGQVAYTHIGWSPEDRAELDRRIAALIKER